ncbi:sulfatase-like hydrolase/transferase [Colwellia echini]|uniref:Sulfatase-like hydrolase/transferase n=1 Tax=Colwellia echini TaxID=1982103 RepID=A0ABY3MYG3_9GAMM|nr:sulfatase-like hydrolase/transferase [Colwellia echini]TYK66273.1 sulfatase-like hydrolase/transferase [Colwellia echini]
MKKLSLSKIVLACTCLIASQVTIASTANERPNILVILTDDMGYADVGFNGSPDIKTPSLDQLAEDGTMMTAAYNAHPFCGPSRAGIMTGRYPHKFGSQFNLPTSDRSGGLGIPTSEVFISEVLQDAGYHTGAIGKWHLGEDGDFHPNNRGFDDFYGFLNGGHDYFPSQFKPQYEKQRKQGLNHSIFHYLRPLEYNGKEVDVNEYLTDALSGQAVDFIKDSASDKDQPFFLYLAYNAPHSPMQAKEEDMAQFPDIKDKKRKTYAGMVYAVDRGVKEIVQTLKDTGQYENTLIVFFSDNGGKPNLGANNYPLRGRKGSVLEGGYRTPMFFHWPKKIPKGETFTFPISTLDLYPTFAELAGAEIPKNKKLDGKNITSSLIAGTNPRPGEMIYAVRHRNGFSEAAARKDNWKIVNVSGNKWQLFDVEIDSSESNDLSKEYPLVVREMVAEMEMWSWTNSQPAWFHIHAEGTLWREKAMPRFGETFSLKDKADNELNVH